ncbi:hypothetical protein [Streptomyces sp. NPDC057496]|uniref:hypothetical protein n=1 Tax=Streptomyces sp. NPDC057496 TaxID=3346149 RepID=UPI0036B0E76A
MTRSHAPALASRPVHLRPDGRAGPGSPQERSGPVTGRPCRSRSRSLTPKGHAFLAGAARSRRENARAAVEALSPGEQAMFTEMCRKVAGSIDTLLH